MKSHLLFRLSFSIALVAFAAVVQAQQRGNQPPPGPPPILVKIHDDLYMIQNPNNTVSDIGNYGGNITVYLTNQGVILVDSKNERMYDDVVAKVKSLTDKPIKYVILTHNHADHAAGAPKLEGIGAQIIISANDRENMTRTANPQWLPQFGYIGQARLFLGGKEVQLREFRGHTRGDTVVLLPAERTAILGDLLTTHEDIPMIVNYGDGGSWTDWTKSIDEILKMDFDNAIPGHGPMITKQQLMNQRNKFVAIQERVRALNRERKTQEEISQTLIKEFNWGAGPSAGNISGMMQELR
jgi:cyclase